MLAASLMVGSASVAGPALADGSAQQVGQVTLFQNPDFTGPVAGVSYTDCQDDRAFFVGLPTVGAFDNRPLPGCQVSLVGLGSRFVLCAGRGTVPSQHRRSSLVLVGPGVTPPCWR